jgi:transcriptional regulator with XRE-family HTH domain
MEFKKEHIMKQPELGQKILELRKQKGFTQEELVEQCNINVRTIQRIEAGDVSPRSYTIKAILEALGFNYEEVFEKKYTPSKFDGVLYINKEKIYKHLNSAIVFGIVYFIIAFFEVASEFLGIENNSAIFKGIYSLIKLVTIISAFIFYRGFVIIGGLYKNYLLQVSAFLIIVFVLFFSFLDIIPLYALEEFIGVFGMAKLLAFGVLSLVFGLAILRLKSFGGLAKWTGILEIITGVCLLLIIFSPIAIFTQFIVEIFEIILLYKVAIYAKKSI